MNRVLLLFLLGVASVPMFARAQGDDAGPTVIVLRPAGEPVPALKYRILPGRLELVPGNAAIFYHRAIQMMLQTGYRRALENRGKEPPETHHPEAEIAEWVSGPIARIPVEEARKQIQYYENALHEVELGAVRKTCDWEFELREETIELMLPEIQEIRSLARLVALRARLAVLEGKTDEAVHWLQTGYAMSRHVSEGTTLIQALVGIAISSVMNATLLDLMQAPGTPSLFWRWRIGRSRSRTCGRPWNSNGRCSNGTFPAFRIWTDRRGAWSMPGSSLRSCRRSCRT